LLSSDVLKQRYSRSPFTAQRRAAASRTDPRHAKLLDLQRQAGNKAVSQMVAAQRQAAGGASVQRAMTTKYTDLRAQFILRGTYGKIVRMLADLEATKAPEERLELATALRGLCNTWLKAHERPGSAKEKQQHQQIEQLEAESFREMGIAQAQMKYLQGFDDTGPVAQGPRQLPGMAPNGRGYLQSPFDPNQQFGQLGALSIGAKLGAAKPAKALAAGQTDKSAGITGAGSGALRFATKYKLNAAELAAIRTYSFPDYSYINPATSNSRGRVGRNLGEVKDPSLNKLALKPELIEMAMKEGAMHAGVLMQALAKIEPFKNKGYRGERLTAQEFYKRYVVGQEVTGANHEPGRSDRGVNYSWFGSASKRRNIAEGYAQGVSGDVRPGKDQTVSVMLEMELTNARDIEKLSGTPKSEYEVLILPGAKFVITAVKKMPAGERAEGNPKATHWAIVRMKQIA
jgi:hypothetical protein